MERSLVEYFGQHEQYRCGYCHSSNTNFSHGMWSHLLTVQDYQDLIDRGWRRSGKFCYKPTMNCICCPQYTICCNALEFKLSKSHKKVLKRVNKFQIKGTSCGEQKVKDETGSVSDQVGRAAESMDTKLAKGSKTPEESQMEMEISGAKNRTVKPGTGADPSKPPCRKAKEIRLERRRQKCLQKESVALSSDGKAASGSLTEEQHAATAAHGNNTAKMLEDYLDEPSKAGCVTHKLEIKLVRSNSKSCAFQELFKQSYLVYHKYQMVVHKDPPEKPSEKQYTRFLVDSPLIQVRLVQTNPPSTEFKFSFTDSYHVFRKYQMKIHGDSPSECTKQDFGEFLVSSPLEKKAAQNRIIDGYGSFHQQYILDGKIIGVGVIDILPKCVSSVYFYYDPEYEFLSLGAYSALREIAFTRSLNKYLPDLKYYYMGYYVHSCPKMKYKGQYSPSFLLCPESYKWHPIENCLPKLDATKYSRFEESDLADADGEVDPNEVLILHDGEGMTFEMYKALYPDSDDEEVVKEYARFVGRKCAKRMLLYRS